MKNTFLFIISVLIPFLAFSQANFKITAGNLKVTGDVNIVLQNTKWTNNATVTANAGTVHLTGSASQSNASIEGTSETTFNNLTINKSTNNAELGQNITVQNTISLINGNLELNNSDLLLNGNYTLQNGHYFQTSGTGSLKRQVTNGSTKTYPVGNSTYTPMTLKNDGTADVFSVRCTPEVLESGTSGNALTSDVVDRTWVIEEDVAGGSDLTLTATWNASDELTGFDRTQSYVSHYTGSGWNGATPNAATGSDPYSISRSGITSLSPFAVGSNGALPIELIDFYAFRESENVKLEWTTATEINSDIFEIEHSLDAVSFKKIGEVRAATFSNSELNYDFLHQNPFDGINYYRLKMRDLDGSFEFSEVRSIIFQKNRNLESFVSIYPNPSSTGFFIIHILMDEVSNARLEIFDKLGRLIHKIPISNLKTQVDVSGLNPGVYLIRTNVDGKENWKRIIIQ